VSTVGTVLRRLGLGRLRALEAELGARHLTTKPYRPRTHGKAERFIPTALREWLYAKPYASSAEPADDRSAWLHWYNHHRPHAGINAATPAARLNNLLGNNS
jgi:transposase InsO family protein